MEGADLLKPTFSIIQFDDARVEIIRTNWAVFGESGEIRSTVFPDIITKKELEAYLKNDKIIDNSWYDLEGNPYNVIKTFSYADNYDDAIHSINYILNSYKAQTNELNTEHLKGASPKKRLMRLTKSESDEDENEFCTLRTNQRKRFIVSEVNDTTKYKTPRLLGYSRRHLRRLVQQRSAVNNQDLINISSDSPVENSLEMLKETPNLNYECKFMPVTFEESSERVFPVHSNEEVDLNVPTSVSFTEGITTEILTLGAITEDKDNLNVPLLLDKSVSVSDSSDDEDFLSNLEALGLNDSDDEFNNNDSVNKNGIDDSSSENVYQIPLFLPKEESHSRKTLLQQGLRDWALKFHITLIALTALLLLLRAIFNVNLPVDARTLLGTLRKTDTTEIDGAIYHHFGLRRAVNNIIQEMKDKGEEIKDIKLVFNIDGLPVSNSGTDNVWIILCSELNSKNVYPVGAAYGKSKPENPNEFLKPFVEEAILICRDGIEDPNVNVSVEAIICDAPAKSYVFCLKGHTGYGSCTKCFIEGKSVLPQTLKAGKRKKKRVCFSGIGPFMLKTDDNFNVQGTEARQKSILVDIPRFGSVSSVPLDYLHLVLLGVTKKLITLWLSGPAKVRLTPLQIQKISEMLLLLRKTIPTEFNRKPRTLLEYKFWKGTEFRTFLLYSGVVVLQNILDKNLYSHFLLLHTAISILISKIHLHNVQNIDCAEEMLTTFVQKFPRLYGEEYVSHNVHNLLHICNDVRKYGVLDNFSAFKFENYLSTVKDMIRTGDKPLQQISRRYSEMEIIQKKKSSNETFLLQQPHSSGPITEDCLRVIDSQYKVLKTQKFCINCTNIRDRCISLKDGHFMVVENILKLKNQEICLVGRQLNFKNSLYEIPDSKLLNIHLMDDCNEQLYAIPLDNVSAKVWRIPSTKGTIVMPLLH